jgi:hypothetical protein
LESASLFSDDYATARNCFKEAAATLGWELSSYPIDAPGPAGVDLTIDVAVGPGTDANRALVISSGVHGVEGFVGSAVQLALLREWASRKDALPAVRVVMLHGLNPFGFAWRRRFNEANIDLNRNLLLEGESFRGSPAGYAELDNLLNPKCPPSPWEPVTLKFLVAIARYGMPALKQAIASGQYDFPQGLFYGGDGPSGTRTVLAAYFGRWLGTSRQVVHLDFHTGLGAWATCKLLIDYSLSETHRQRLSRWFGPESFEATDPKKIAFAVRGSFGHWCMSQNLDRDYLYAAAEFGTYKPTRVLGGLRAENQAYHWGKPGVAATETAKTRLVELFCPRSESWRMKVLNESKRLVKQAIDGLVGETETQGTTTPA